MKSLFAEFFNISVACGILILVVIGLRLVLKRAPKVMVCVLWGLVFLRLALPFHIESPLSLRPNLPVVTEDSTGLYFESELIPEEKIPDYIPRDRANYSFDGWSARVDYVQLAAWVWAAGVATILLYMLISYVRLRYRLRGAVRLRDNIYTSEKLTDGYLLGYIFPQIYLPEGLDEETGRMVIAHEQAHRRRGDNWLKLFAFGCLAFHWYNPLVWLAYILLCNDMEYACDEQVIRKLSERERIAYSTALLSMEKKRNRLRVCPLPFGESSVRRRIITVLRYRKPAIWISAVAAAAVLFSAVFLLPDPVPDYPPYYKTLTSMLGKSRESVAREMDIVLQEDENSAAGYYKTPLRVKYEGVPMDIVLSFSIVDDRLWGFQYVAIYENNVEQAAKDTVKIAKQLQRSYGTAKQSGNKRTLWLSEIDEEAVLRKFENRYLAHEGIDTVSGYWQLSEVVGAKTRDYWEELQSSERWQTMWQERNITLGYGLQLSAWNNPDSDQTYLCLDYGTAYHFGGSTP